MSTTTRNKHYKSRHADEVQKEVYRKFPSDSFLGNEQNMNHVLLWSTFFRRNLHRFATDYLGINLHIYQAILLYLMGICQFIVVVASRAAAKSFIIALYACCRCITRPYTHIVLASANKRLFLVYNQINTLKVGTVMYSKWTPQEEELLLTNYKKMNYEELSSLIGKSKSQIQTKGWRMRLSFDDRWTIEEEQYVKDHYSQMTYSDMSQVITRSKTAIQAKCRKLGLQKAPSTHKKKLNSSFFETIDSESKAYWLGFICADGCVHQRRDGSRSFKITLQRRDADHLRKFINAIDGDFDVKLKTAQIKNGDSVKSYETCEISFRDQKFTEDLLRYFPINKTANLSMPRSIPEHLVRHFIRGFADGDGCFYCNPTKKDKSFEVVGMALQMLEDLQSILASHGICAHIYRKRQTNWKLMVCKLRDIICLISYLYDGATIYLDRKYSKAQEIVKLASPLERAG